MAKAYKGAKAIVDLETGEVEGIEENVVGLQPGDSYRTKEQVEFFYEKDTSWQEKKKERRDVCEVNYKCKYCVARIIQG